MKRYVIDFENDPMGICIHAESEWHARKLVENPSTWKDGKARIVSCIMEEKEYYKINR